MQSSRARPGRATLGLATLLLAASAIRCASTATSAPCAGDSDGINGGQVTFDLSVDDTTFSPSILKAQNLAQVTLTLRNAGTKPHDFVVTCLATPNGNGCPATSCFPDASTIGPLAPDASATTTFATPNPEGIYVFRSDLPGDTQTGQFVVQ